jgi:hypothetical protein
MIGLAPDRALSGVLVASLLVCWDVPEGLAGLGRQQPAPPSSPPTRYDPDRTTCEPERIRSAFQQQLQPYADQSDAVIAQLRRVQLDMTRSTLRRCVSRDLLSRPQADQLFNELSTSPTRP